FKDLVDIFVNDKYKIEAKAVKYLEVVLNKTEFFRTYLESKISKENNVQTNINELKNDNKAQKKSGGMMFNFGNKE
ncbi:hypothetical protein, partial [Campylobacter coli]|uniref:hypothetical protein n=1 Tax=Campylobacter coli TaxID=195 RepID=UPI0018DFAD9F